MKTAIIVLLVLLGFTETVNAQQISIFNKEGEARAYIDFDKNGTIYMWDGSPVAFITTKGKDMCIIGFNGNFLGWYIDGIVYDKKGEVVGARQGALNMNTKIEKIKGIQKITPIRPITPITPIRPMLKNNWSNTSLSEFLFSGKK
jgi:hypothetical protein